MTSPFTSLHSMKWASDPLLRCYYYRISLSIFFIGSYSRASRYQIYGKTFLGQSEVRSVIYYYDFIILEQMPQLKEGHIKTNDSYRDNETLAIFIARANDRRHFFHFILIDVGFFFMFYDGTTPSPYTVLLLYIYNIYI